ncbi:MAG: peptidylprolyl isomerase [Muribaculaceae bacterium]|nr:peptidylprolyl isomerase [Muribaculaceae bacterium]
MKTKFLLGGALGVCALAWGAKDQVIMTVNGVDVPKSEFEYLYHKNSQQQLAPQPLDEYVEMFKNYRLKVADALAAGIDTTESFRQEMAQYRHDLAQPYIADSLYINSLVKEAYDRSLEEIQSSHIMIFKGRDEQQNIAAVATLDSLRNVIENGEDFELMAARYSQDRGSAQKGGMLGWITAGKLPYTYEVTAYSLKPGQISEVIQSPMAYHILKGGARRPARGQVHVSHIMKMVQPGSDEQTEAKAKASIDSIYALLQVAPGRFEELAVNFSEDPGSARNGGLLPWFGAGQMVEEFDSVSFALPLEGISQPFRSPYGWHIVYKVEERGVPSIDELKPVELKKMSNPQDERFNMIREHQTASLAKKYNAGLNQVALDRLRLGLLMNGLDSLYYQQNNTPSMRAMEIGHIGKTPLLAGELLDYFHYSLQPNPTVAEKLFNNNVELFFNNKLVEREEQNLEAEVPEYRNLLHEYENGSLLYEVSVKKVWDPASKDEEGLKKYFESHRDDYKWREPRVKGILVQAKNDSVANAVLEVYPTVAKGSEVSALRKLFGKDIVVDKVLVARGQNPMVDNLYFGAPEVKPSGNNYTTYFMLDGVKLDAPQDVYDVKGQVTSDYQEYLEQQWIDELRAKYPVTVNNKVLKKVK